MAYFKTRDGKKLHVRVLGRGKPVVMLHGLGMSSFMWLPVILPHIRRHQFVMPDFRGHGKSIDVPLNQQDVFQNHCEDVQDMIAELKLDNFILGGISLGCTTALHLQRDTGFKGVSAYLHIDQSPNVVNGPDWGYGLAGSQQDDLFHAMRNLLALLPEESGATNFASLPTNQKRQASKQLANILKILGTDEKRCLQIESWLPKIPLSVAKRMPLLKLADMRAYLSAYSGQGHDYRPTLNLGQVPTTQIIGARSPLYDPIGQQAVTDNNPHGQAILFNQSGHVPITDEPLRFQREFRRFLKHHC